MKAYISNGREKTPPPLSEFDMLVIETKQGTITIQLGEDRGKEDSVKVSCLGEGLPALVVTPDGGINTIRLRVGLE